MNNPFKSVSCIYPAILLVFSFLISETVFSQNISVEIESGVLWFSKNDVRAPGNGGTEFDMLSLIETDPFPFYRLRLYTTFNRHHTFRILLAPMRITGTGPLFEPVLFNETEFLPFVPTRGNYKFNSYRLTYQYLFYAKNGWKLAAGAAALVRDVEIELVQSNTRDSVSHWDFLPLVHFHAEKDWGSSLSSVFDLETLATARKRTIDAAVTLNYRISPSWKVHTGYRITEGGSESDNLYNFSMIHYGFLGFQLNAR